MIKHQAALEWAKIGQPLSCSSVCEHHVRAIHELWPIIEKVKPQIVLECGAGEPPSAMSEMLRHKDIQVIGIDFISKADIQVDMHTMPFVDKSFNLAVARHTLEHCIAPYLALSEMKRVAYYLLVVVPQDSTKFRYWGGHLNVYPREIWEMIFRRLNLGVCYFGVGDFSEPGKEGTDFEWRYLLREGKPQLDPANFKTDGHYVGPIYFLANGGWTPVETKNEDSHSSTNQST